MNNNTNRNYNNHNNSYSIGTLQPRGGKYGRGGKMGRNNKLILRNSCNLHSNSINNNHNNHNNHNKKINIPLSAPCGGKHKVNYGGSKEKPLRIPDNSSSSNSSSSSSSSNLSSLSSNNSQSQPSKKTKYKRYRKTWGDEEKAKLMQKVNDYKLKYPGESTSKICKHLEKEFGRTNGSLVTVYNRTLNKRKSRNNNNNTTSSLKTHKMELRSNKNKQHIHKTNDSDDEDEDEDGDLLTTFREYGNHHNNTINNNHDNKKVKALCIPINQNGPTENMNDAQIMICLKYKKNNNNNHYNEETWDKYSQLLNKLEVALKQFVYGDMHSLYNKIKEVDVSFNDNDGDNVDNDDNDEYFSGCPCNNNNGDNVDDDEYFR